MPSASCVGAATFTSLPKAAKAAPSRNSSILATHLCLAALQEKEEAADDLLQAEKVAIDSVDVDQYGVPASDPAVAATLEMSDAGVEVSHGFLGQPIDPSRRVLPLLPRALRANHVSSLPIRPSVRLRQTLPGRVYDDRYVVFQVFPLTLFPV